MSECLQRLKLWRIFLFGRVSMNRNLSYCGTNASATLSVSDERREICHWECLKCFVGHILRIFEAAVVFQFQNLKPYTPNCK